MPVLNTVNTLAGAFSQKKFTCCLFSQSQSKSCAKLIFSYAKAIRNYFVILDFVKVMPLKGWRKLPTDSVDKSVNCWSLSKAKP
jgi:hypothetical protein